MIIKDQLRKKVHYSKLKDGLFLLQRLTTDYELVDLLSNQISRLQSNHKKYLNALIVREEYEKLETEIRLNFLNEIQNLPSDLEILKGKLKNIVSGYSIITDALDILQYLSKEPLIYKLNGLSERFSESQEYSLNEDESGREDHWTELNSQIIIELMQIIDEISFSDLKDHWENDFLDFIERMSYSYFAKIHDHQLNGAVSDFYPDINKIQIANENFKIKGILFNWLEKYITEEYDNAFNLLVDTRDAHGIGNSQFYEYLAMTYIRNKKIESYIKNILVKNDDKEFRRIIFYIERINDSSKTTGTKAESLKFIQKRILQITKNVYQNILHDYIKNETPKGRSKKRDIIKRCLDLVLQLIKTTNFFDIDDIMPFAVELEGGGKFRWIEIKSNGQLSNLTVYNAIASRDEFHRILKNVETINEELFHSLKSKVLEIQKDKGFSEGVKNRLYYACMLGYHNFEDEKYIGLIKQVEDGVRFIDEKNKKKDLSIKKGEFQYELSNFLNHIGIKSWRVSQSTIDNIIAYSITVKYILDKNTNSQILNMESNISEEGNYFSFSANSETKFSSNDSLLNMKLEATEDKNDKLRMNFQTPLILIICNICLFIILIRWRVYEGLENWIFIILLLLGGLLTFLILRFEKQD